MIGEKIFCGLDIGSRQIKAGLIKIKKADRFDILGVFEVTTKGLKDASVSDLGELSEAAETCLKGLGKRANVKFKDVQLGVSGNLIEHRYSNAVIPLLDRGSKVIVTGDVKKVSKQARLLGAKMEEEVLHDFAQQYVIDDNNPATNPIGLFGRKLEVNFLLVLAKNNILNNIRKAVSQAGYEVGQTSFSSLLAAEVAMAHKSKMEGCVLVDMGANTTDVLIFKDGILHEVDIIHLGGNQMTAAVAQALDIPFDLAEDIKKSYAVTLSTDSKEEGEFLIKKDTQYVPIKRDVIYRAIEPEIARIVSCIQNSIRHSRIYDRLNTGIMMVGGAALLPGLIERIEKDINLPVKIGHINITTTGLNNSAVFAGAIGLARAGFMKPSRNIVSSGTVIHWRGQLANRIKEWYQEYF